MKILYLLYDEKENQNYQITSGYIRIYVLKGNKEFLTATRQGIRFDRIYIDHRLNTLEYGQWIDGCIKGLASLPGSCIIYI